MLDLVTNGIINAMFSMAPFKRSELKPEVTPMPSGAETIETTYDRGIEIKIVAVAKVKVAKAYVISAARERAAGHTFKLQTEKRLVPIDLFLGWGVMSSPFSTRFFDYAKVYGDDGSRTIVYQSDEYKVERAFGNCAHVHMMNPINLKMPAPGDCVSFEGYLVDVYIDGVCTWPTDLTMGDENCETIYPLSFKKVS